MVAKRSIWGSALTQAELAGLDSYKVRPDARGATKRWRWLECGPHCDWHVTALQYSSIDTSPLAQYVMKPYWTWVVSVSAPRLSGGTGLLL